MEFPELARVRGELRESVVNHVESLKFFRNEGDNSFLKTVADVANPQPDDGRLHGITTTLTCAESLYDQGLAGQNECRTVLEGFVPRALASPREWESEGAAKVYCRVRALAPLLQLSAALSPLNPSDLGAASKLLNEAWARVSLGEGTDGVFEVDRSGARENRYPPNAYLTYFGLAALSRLPEAVKGGKNKRLIAESWLEKCLGSQVALHYQGSAQADPQQLAWAISGLVRFRSSGLVEGSLPALEMIEAGLKAFFAQQQDGMWARGEPLFHYPQAGNAYCYVFETLAELVHLAVDGTPRATLLRRLLRPYGNGIVESFRYLMATSKPLPGGRLQGWCSGHHPHRTSPESWATACVYRFLEGARRLFGIWTRDEAARLLGARQARVSRGSFKSEGDSWDAGYGSSGAQLSTLFVHPVICGRGRSQPYDPDEPAIGESGGRSAILYGPPGTGKTTLVEAIAGSLGWAFVEVTPALFLEKGMEFVSARADEVFRQLMELDECVILFDEIDELIRNRDAASDPLERFFTTTMLPRLSKLWSQRKVLFFVNTNGITEVDPAIRRSSRFDAAVFVLPPSFEAKRRALENRGVVVAVKEAQVSALLDGKMEGIPETMHDLVWFGLVRYDQIPRLAARLASAAADPANVTDAELVAELKTFGGELMASDWRDPTVNRGDAMTLQLVIKRFKELRQEQRLDHSRVRVVEASIEAPPPASVEVLMKPEQDKPGYWRVDGAGNNLCAWAHENGYELDCDGQLRQ